MNQDIENIILLHNFQELTVEQKLDLKEYATTEEEFEILQQILITAPILDADVAPTEKLNSSLTETFKTFHSHKMVVDKKSDSDKTVVLWLKVAVSIAAIFVLFFFLFPTEKDLENKVITAENKNSEGKVKTLSPKKPKISTDKEVENSKSIDDLIPVPVLNDRLAVVDRDVSSSNYESFPTTYLLDEVAEINSHSDRIDSKDLPESSSQVIQENPELLAILYTSF